MNDKPFRGCLEVVAFDDVVVDPGALAAWRWTFTQPPRERLEPPGVSLSNRALFNFAY